MIRKAFLPVLILGSMLLSGCWDATDVEELSVPLVSGYDTAEHLPDARVTTTGIFVPISSKEETVEIVEAQTIGATRGSRVFSSPKTFTIVQLQAALYGKEIALQGIDKYIDILIRSPFVKNSLFIAVVDGRADQLMYRYNQREKSQGSFKIVDLLKIAPQNGFIPKTTLHKYIVCARSRGKTAVAPILALNANDKLKIVGSVVFKEDKMIAQFDQRETRLMMLLRGEKSQGYIPFRIVGRDMKGQGTVFVANSRQVDVQRSGNRFDFYITVKLRGRLVEYNGTKADSSTDKDYFLSQVEETLARDLEKQMENFIRLMQEEIGVDCINISPYALAKWRSELNEQVDKGFINRVNVFVDVKVELQNVGEIS